MNMDFHYYGTYLAAVGAGFSAAEAGKIAWAAQMTDDCTQSLLNSTEGSRNWTCRVPTCQSNSELAEIIVQPKMDMGDAELKNIRNIWMPFHFLPGNLNGYYKYAGETAWRDSAVFSESRDTADFKCICLHNSDLVYTMIDDMVSRCSVQSGADTRDKLLYLIGIRMHVLADTWAHEYFAGTPNFWVNDVKDMSKLEGMSAAAWAAPPGASFYSVFYLGHAQAGHYPDYGSIAYQFRPHWLKPGSGLDKNNPSIFLAAFCQMLDALTAIFAALTNPGNPAAFPRGEEYNVPGGRMLIAAHNITADDILSVVKTRNKDQSRAWKKLLSDKDVVDEQDMDAFDYRINDPRYKLEHFCENAEIHRNLVARYLEQSGVGIHL